MRRLGLVLLLVALLVAGIGQPAQAEWRPRYKLLHLINEARGGNVYWARGTTLQKVAGVHTVKMRKQGRIFHSYARPCWYVGENVGVIAGDGAMRRIFDAFMDSPTHRRNILDPGFRRVGIGVAVGGGFIWVTLIFCG